MTGNPVTQSRSSIIILVTSSGRLATVDESSRHAAPVPEVDVLRDKTTLSLDMRRRVTRSP